MFIIIDGKPISEKQVDQWRLARIPKALRTMKRTLDTTGNLDVVQNDLTEMKLEYSYPEMYNILRGQLTLSTLAMKVAVKLSPSTKFAKTEIFIKGVSTESVSTLLDGLMLESTPEHNRVNLAACPEHFVLRPTGANQLEVIETCGNSPLPFQFFITFGDESEVKTPREPSFEYQSVGTARLENSAPIGGVRHQFKDIDGGVLAKLCVEFPSMTPTTIIKAHQMHLASEFSYWLKWIRSQTT